MYEAFYKFSARPFNTSPDPQFLYWADSHSMAFTMLRYGLMAQSSISVLTGEIGSGKTTLLRQLLREIPADLEVGLVSNMQAGRGELLHWAMMALGQPVEAQSYVQIFKQFQDHVIKSYAQGRRVVLVFDEAQNLDVATLEELRMLSNINADENDLLQLILVGQPQLRELLGRPELEQFSQRISADFHLKTLNRVETEAYITHRIAVAGGTWRIFPPRTCVLIHAATRGVPRLVNILCDLCLVYGFAAEERVIGEDLLIEFLEGVSSRRIFEQFSPISEALAQLDEIAPELS
jgi:type II secretory pathway predicted ATPase ExeA